MSKIIKLSVFLALVAGLSAASLSYVYNLTAPVIKSHAREKEQAELKSLYAQEVSFTSVSQNLSKYEALEKCYLVKQGKKRIGYVYKIAVTGYGGEIVYLLKLDTQGVYSGYKAIDVSSETKGFGSRVGTSEMRHKIVNHHVGDDIDTLSGATISSSAVVNGIKQASTHYQATFKKGAPL